MAPKVWLAVVVAALLLLPLVQSEPIEGKAQLATPELALTGNADKYAALMSSIERELRLTTSTPLPIKNRRPVLGVQKFDAQLLYVVLKGGSGQSTTLALRTDNVYLVGFKTMGGSWYMFEGEQHFIPGSKSLGFRSDYTSLTGPGGHSNLGGVVLGRKSAQEAVATLGSYTSSTPDQEIKKALTRLVVMVCEATRFAPIRAAVKAAWEDGAHLPQVGVQLVVRWRATSCALLVWNRAKTKKWDTIQEVTSWKLEENGDPKMVSVDAALDNIYLLLRPSKKEACSDGKTA